MTFQTMSNDKPENPRTIVGTVNIVARDFLSLARELSSHEKYALQVPVVAVEDEFARFKVCS